MKRLLFLLAGIFAVAGINAQNENPRGLYLLQKFTYDDGTEKEPPFKQYKYSADNAVLTILALEDEYNKGGVTKFRMYQNDDQPHNYTGNIPVGEDGKGLQIFNSNKKGFTLRWYNNSIPNNPLFPFDAFTNEIYSSKKGISKNIALALDLMKMNTGKPQNKFQGVWRQRGTTSSYDITNDIYAYKVIEKYQIFSADALLALYDYDIDESLTTYVGQLCPYKYYSETSIDIAGNPCIVKWLSDSSFALIYVDEQNSTKCEIWDRCGLPKDYQTLFGTDVAINIVPRPEKKDISHDPSYLVGTWVANNENETYTLTYGNDGTVKITVEKQDTLETNEETGEKTNAPLKIETSDTYTVSGDSIIYKEQSVMNCIADIKANELSIPYERFSIWDLQYPNGETSYTLSLTNQKGFSINFDRRVKSESSDSE